MRETGNFNSKQIVKSRWFHNWAAPLSQHLMLFRHRVHCQFWATLVSSHLLSSCASGTPQYQGTMRRFLRGTGKPPQDQLVQLVCPESWPISTVRSILRSPRDWWVQSSLNHCCHNLHNCPAGCWARNAAVIVPKLAEIGDNYEFVNQFRPLWSAGPAQDVKFCDEKTERPFLSQPASKEMVDWLHVPTDCQSMWSGTHIFTEC